MKPTIQDQQKFLFQAYFGGGKPDLELFISRAYRDMNRTFHGIGELDEAKKILEGAKANVKDFFLKLGETPQPSDKIAQRKVFDEWHQESCGGLIKYYNDKLYEHPQICLRYGQAQKWVNMTFKYCWVCGNDEKINRWLPAAHVPVDKVIRAAAKNRNVMADVPDEAWSKWGQSQYIRFQEGVRDFADRQDKLPLELEFEWWLRRMRGSNRTMI